MANHRKKTSISLPSLNKRQWVRIGAVAAALALVVTGGIMTRSFYASDGRSAAQQVTAYSATDPLTVSRGSARDGVRGMEVVTGGIMTRSFYASDGRSAAQQVTAYSATDPLTVSRGSARDGVRGMDGDTGGIMTRSFYASDGRSAAQQVTAYSATDPLTVSRGSARDGVRGMDGDTSYVTVKLDGQSRTVLGTDFTTVKSVLEAGNITLGPNDTVDPALDAEVDESTVITIETADSVLETSEEPIAFNTVRKETSSLPEGTEQVETEGEEGVMETTSLVTRAGDTVISSNVFASYVKKAPVDKVILVGTQVETEGEEGVMETTSLVTRAGDTVISSNVFASYVKKAPVDKVILVGTGSASSGSSSSSSASIGTTVPAGEMQQWAHDYLLANGYTEADFSATVTGSASSGSSSSSSASIGTTVPAGEMQQWAHDYLLANGYTEADFSATVYIINHESGWRVNATNASSGAYGLPQALPGSKMASAGADWATNYQTQLKWFWGYCSSRYGSVQGAYNFWVANHWY